MPLSPFLLSTYWGTLPHWWQYEDDILYISEALLSLFSVATLNEAYIMIRYRSLLLYVRLFQ